MRPVTRGQPHSPHFIVDTAIKGVIVNCSITGPRFITVKSLSLSNDHSKSLTLSYLQKESQFERNLPSTRRQGWKSVKSVSGMTLIPTRTDRWSGKVGQNKARVRSMLSHGTEPVPMLLG